MNYTCTLCGGNMKQVGMAIFECEQCGAEAYLLDEEDDELTFDIDIDDHEWTDYHRQYYDY